MMARHSMTIGLLGLTLTVVGVRDSAAQPRRFEIAASTTTLRLNTLDSAATGVGGRLTFDLTNWLAIEGEASFFPKDNIVQPFGSVSTVSYDRRRTDAFFGAKAGVREKRFGVFGKIRPGVTRLTFKGIGCDGAVCAFALFIRPEYRTEFALDAGGGFELYPSTGTVVRFDLSDVLIWNRPLAAPPCANCTTHNLASRVGVGWRF